MAPLGRACPTRFVREGAVVVTGMGAASALGTGIEAHRAALWAGRDGLRPIERFDARAMSTQLGAMWPGWAGRTQPEVAEGRDLLATSRDFPLHELALVAAREAWSASGVVASSPARAALVFGTCYGQGFTEFSPVAERVASGLDLAGPCITISTACASSTNAIGLARDLLLHGDADVVLAGGADVLLREAQAGFSALGVLSSEPCAPFSDPPGTTLGEGAAFIVLERADAAAARGAQVLATICGYGLSGDAFHETTPDPTGNGLARAIREALRDAGWVGSDVEFVNAHATGTANNDRIEWSVIERELGTKGRPPHVSGTKGHVGHAQGAAGALELVLALICQREGRLPPTLHFRGPRLGCPTDPVAGSEPRAVAVSHAIKISAAFGGANAVLAYAYGSSTDPPHGERGRVALVNAAVVGSHGALRLPNILELEGEPKLGAAREVDLDALGVDARRLDRSSRLLTSAAALALEGVNMEGMGLFVAATRMPEESSRRCMESIQQRGIAGTSASAFARMTVNAPAGACARALGLLGPTSTMSSGASSGLLAWVTAADWLARRDDARGIVVGGVDELSGAVCAVLVRSASASAVIAAGWGIAGRGGALAAAEHAMTGLAPVDGLMVDLGGQGGGSPRWDSQGSSVLKQFLAPHPTLGVIDASRLWGDSEATRSGVLAAVAAAHIAQGHARSILVVAAHGASSVALVLERSEA
jgi:3-oxoacyl-[acyl-carrier-protein] synthase II